METTEDMIAKATVAQAYREIVDSLRKVAAMPEMRKIDGASALTVFADSLEVAIEKTTL